jgi:G:T-mismatch repair DNA endonuclease (very short patch repair protein)
MTHEHHMKNRKKSIVTRRKMSVSRALAWERPEYRAKIARGVREFNRDHPERYQGINKPFFGKHHSTSARALMSKSRIGVFNGYLETRLLMSDNYQGKRNPFYGKKHTPTSLRKILSTANHRPNKFEMMVKTFLDKRFPNVWKYCGNGSVVLNGHCPDFINSNGQKRVILANGVYWHTKRLGRNKRDAERIEMAPYNELGFDVIFIWDDDFRKGVSLNV